MKKGSPIKIPMEVDLHIEEFAAGVVTEKESGAINVVLDQYKDGRWYATQRPGVNQLEDLSVEQAVEAPRGRGIYYWDAIPDKYIVNDDVVYKTSYSGSTMSISAGTERVFMYEVGEYLVIIDQENNEGWTIDSATPTVIAAIADLDFPPNQTPALSLARHGAVLNGKLFLMTTDGDIYESDIEDPTSWQALSVRNAEVEPDAGVILTKHHEHIIALGTRTLEFFEDTANATGSSLSSRTDIQYDVGAIDEDSLVRIGNRTYFVGQDKSNAVGVFMLDGFSLKKVSDETIDTFLTSAVTTDMMGLHASGNVSGGREFYALTLFNLITDIVPVTTLVLVSTRGMWGHWDVQLPDVDHYPLMDWAPSTTTRAGEGILSNGDLVTMQDDFNPVDTVGASAVYEDGIYEPGIYTATSGSGTSIPFEIITGDFDAESPMTKYQGDLWLMHTPLSVDESVTVAVKDDEDAEYGTGRSLSVGDKDARLTRMGSFRRRNFKINGQLSKQIRMEFISSTARIG